MPSVPSIWSERSTRCGAHVVVDGGTQRLEVRLVTHPPIGALDECEAFDVIFGNIQIYVGIVRTTRARIWMVV